MAGVTFEFKGMDLDRLLEVFRDFPAQAGQALREEAEIEMTEAKQRTPVLTGALRGSGTVVGPVQDNGDTVVVLAFGVSPSVSAAYAVEVHENMEMFHPRGGQAKFLESVVLESAPYIASRVAERIQAGLGVRYAPTTASLGANSDALARLRTGLDDE